MSRGDGRRRGHGHRLCTDVFGSRCVFGLHCVFGSRCVFGLRQVLRWLRWVFRRELAGLGLGGGRALVVARNLIPRRSFVLIWTNYIIRFVRFSRLGRRG